MRKTRMIMVSVLIVLSILFTACMAPPNSAVSSGGAENAATGEQKKIGFSIMGMSAPYFVPVSESAVETGKELGAEVTIFDAEFSSEKQVSQIKNMIAQKYDAIIFIPVDSQSLSNVLQEAKDAGIPTIDVNIPLDDKYMELITSYVGYDEVQFGKTAGESLVKALGDKGGKVVEIQGVPGTESTRMRAEGFKQGISANTNIEIVDTKDASGDRAEAMAKMEDFLTRYTDIAGVYVYDDNMAIGAIQAIKAADRLDEIKVVSIAGSSDGLDAIRAGELFSTVFQDPVWEGKTSVTVAMDAINGKDVEAKYIASSPSVDKDNVDEFESLW